MSRGEQIVVTDCDDVALVQQLFTEYLDGTIAETGLPNPEQSPGVLEAMRLDITQLPGPYVAPDGALLVAWIGERPAGSVGLARVDEHAVEVRRLWVRHEFRRAGVARALMVACLERAAALGYVRIVLDVVPERTGAIQLYRALGFHEIGPYDEYPFPMVFLGRDLRER